MAKVTPWSVKGVEPEAREAAKIAARRAGLTLGQWLNQTIRIAAAEQLASPSRTPQYTGEDGAGRSDHAETDGAPPHGMAYRSHPPAPTNESIFENLINLSNRIERTEMKAEAAVAPLADHVERLSGKVEQFTEQVEQIRSQAAVSTAPVERAVQRLSERLEKIEETQRASSESRRRSLFSRDG